MNDVPTLQPWIVIFIVIFFMILIYVKYKNKSPDKYCDLSYIEGQMKTSCQSYISTQKPHFSHCQTPIYLNYNEALVVYGNIPHKYVYWGITGYSLNKGQLIPIGDSVSSRYINGATNTKIVTVLCNNPKLFKAIERDIKKELQCSGYLCVVNAIYTPREKEYNTVKYCLQTKTVVLHKEDQIPEWKCRLYKSQNIDKEKAEYQELLCTECSVSETHLIDPEIWESSCYKIAKEKFEKITKVDVFEAQYDTRDCKCVSSNTIPSGKEIFIIAVDHVRADKSKYSCINFYTEYIVTGNNEQPLPSEKAIVLRFIEYKTTCPIKIKELIFTDPSQKSCIGPDISTILPMQVYIHK